MLSTRIGISSARILAIPALEALIGARPIRLGFASSASLQSVAGWGLKANTRRARRYTDRHGLNFLTLEDGFLRSFGTGNQSPPLSLVLDEEGIYYDSTRPSSLESLLNGSIVFLNELSADAEQAKKLILEQHLSKYNHAPVIASNLLRADDIQRILVVDQTLGDLSVSGANASKATFAAMLAAAQSENPLATIYVKTHPETSAGRKGGYLTAVRNSVSTNGQYTVVLRGLINPIDLVSHMDRVYVVSSTMGFEALLAGKQVICFGIPWYSGWGSTDDRQHCNRRILTRTTDELFLCAYLHYVRYLDPTTHQRGTIFDVITWLIRQRAMANKFFKINGPGRLIIMNFEKWRIRNLKPLLSLESERVVFASSIAAAEELNVGMDDCLLYWGADAPSGLADLAKRSWARLIRLEDGFIRSVGLGSDLIRPLSLVLDEQGIYFDPSRPSDLENILNTGVFTDEELAESRKVRDFIVTHGITKYNLEPRNPPVWQSTGREIILVPGQVEDDASIRLGCPATKTNLGLLQAVRAAHPDAFIVYKPHPDVVSRNRKGRMALKDALAFADHVETEVSVVSCIEACDVVHTMTSLTGFDALLRGKRVVVHGLPFYAGWGLTEDVLADAAVFQRRQRRLCLDELVVGVLLRYPIYWDWDLKGYTTCEAVLNRIVETRTKLEANGGLQRLRAGFVRRQLRKLGILLRAYLPSKLERWVSL